MADRNYGTLSFFTISPFSLCLHSVRSSSWVKKRKGKIKTGKNVKFLGSVDRTTTAGVAARNMAHTKWLSTSFWIVHLILFHCWRFIQFLPQSEGRHTHHSDQLQKILLSLHVDFVHILHFSLWIRSSRRPISLDFFSVFPIARRALRRNTCVSYRVTFDLTAYRTLPRSLLNLHWGGLFNNPSNVFHFYFFWFENFLQRFSKDRMFEEKYVKEKISNDDPCR